MIKKVLFLLMTITLLSCSNRPENVEQSLNDFVNKTQQNASSYNEGDWKKSNKELNEYLNKLNGKPMSDSLRSQINAIIGRYRGLQIKAGIQEFKSGLQDLMEQTKSAIQTLTDSTTNSGQGQDNENN